MPVTRRIQEHTMEVRTDPPDSETHNEVRAA